MIIIGLPTLAFLFLFALPILRPYGERHPSRRPAAVTAGRDPVEQLGARLFVTKGCFACHAIGGAGGRRGPDLDAVAGRLGYDRLVTRILSGGGGMPAYANTLTADETEALARLLLTRTPP